MQLDEVSPPKSLANIIWSHYCFFPLFLRKKTRVFDGAGIKRVLYADLAETFDSQCPVRGLENKTKTRSLFCCNADEIVV